MTYSRDEFARLVVQSFGETLVEQGAEPGQINAAIRQWNPQSVAPFFDNLYKPDDILRQKICEYIAWKKVDANRRKRTAEENAEAGHLMEQIALLSFQCLTGHGPVKSYSSYSQQHDLVISGNSPEWFLLMEMLHLPRAGRTIVIESKNKKSRVSDDQFTRLCHKIQNTFSSTCDLGVFVSRNGASGFPSKESGRIQSLRDPRATQILFHARTMKFVVVLDDSDIERLGETGELPRILERKIREVEESTGLPYSYDEDYQEGVMPPHLAKYRSTSSES